MATKSGAQPCQIHIKKDELFGRSFVLLDAADDDSPLYAVEVQKQTRPHVQVWRVNPSAGPDRRDVGTATFHGFGSTADIVLANGGRTVLKREAWLSRSRTVHTPFGRLDWNADGALSSDLKLVHADGTLLARFSRTRWSVIPEKGVFELVRPVETEMLDVIVVTGMAVIVQADRTRYGEYDVAASYSVG